MYQKEIESYFESHRQEMIADICRLVRIDSSRGKPLPGKPFGEGPAAVLAEALRMADGMGLKTKNYDNYVGTVDLNDRPHQLDILVHLDVVPAGDGWTVTRPFEPVTVEGRLYGRGTADDKGPAVAALYALRAARDMKLLLRRGVRLILGTDEECGSSDIRHYYQKEAEAPMTFSPDADFPLVNIEKGRFSDTFSAEWAADTRVPRLISFDGGVKDNVVPGKAVAVIEGFARQEAEKYAAAAARKTGTRFQVREEGGRLTVEAVGHFAHASAPETGNNAVTGLLELLAGMPFAPSEGFRRLLAVRSLFPHGDWAGRACGVAMSDAISGPLTMTLDILHVTETGLTGCFDSRTPVCATDANMRRVMQAKVSALGIRLGGKAPVPAHHVPGDSPFIRALLKCYEQYTGRRGECLAIGGGTYVHGLKNGVAFGCEMPGSEPNMHGPDEKAVVEDLVTSAKIFTQAIADLCGA